VQAVQEKGAGPVAILDQPVYFPYLPKQDRIQQTVPMTFPRRGTYCQESFRIVTRFPFGFLQKARRLDMKTEALVYPSVEPTAEYMEVMPVIQGALESLSKGHGQDLYSLREYLPSDSARLVDWKATARSGSLMVREFACEEDSRVLLVLDPHLPASEEAAAKTLSPAASARFERGVTICANLAWHFYQGNSLLQFISVGFETPLTTAEENIFKILRHLALAHPLPHDPEGQLMKELAAHPHLFKIIITSQPRGSIPYPIWSSSYLIFLNDPN